MFISPEQSVGNIVKMKTNHPLHYTEIQQTSLDDDVSGYVLQVLRCSPDL